MNDLERIALNLGSYKKDKHIYTAYFKELVDVVEHEGNPIFLVNDENEPKLLPQIENWGRINVPPPIEQFHWILPSAEEVMKYHRQTLEIGEKIADFQLFEDLISYHKSVSELPSEEYYVLLAAWVLHTYLIDSFDYSPILLFYAVPERGKSRTGKGLIYVSHRGIHTETLNEANLFRWSHNHRASIFFDVRDLWQKAEKRGSDDILLSRIEKGCRVSRVLWPEKGAFRDTASYDVFGPTIIATNETIHHILETRSISITMSDSAKRFENPVTPANALPLKERLLDFRLRHMWRELPQVKKPAHARLGDILKPLYQMVMLANPERETDFLSLVIEIEAGRKLDKSQGLEAQLIQTVRELENAVTNGFLPVMNVTELYNLNKPDRQKLTPQRIGRRLKALGFESGRNGDGSAAIAYDTEKIVRLMAAYGLPLTSETPDTSEIPF